MGCDVIPLDETIAERAVDLRRNHRIFAADDPSVRLPYKL